MFVIQNVESCTDRKARRKPAVDVALKFDSCAVCSVKGDPATRACRRNPIGARVTLPINDPATASCRNLGRP
jgi:hypothetical protein